MRATFITRQLSTYSADALDTSLPFSVKQPRDSPLQDWGAVSCGDKQIGRACGPRGGSYIAGDALGLTHTPHVLFALTGALRHRARHRAHVGARPNPNR